MEEDEASMAEAGNTVVSMYVEFQYAKFDNFVDAQLYKTWLSIRHGVENYGARLLVTQFPVINFRMCILSQGVNARERHQAISRKHRSLCHFRIAIFLADSFRGSYSSRRG